MKKVVLFFIVSIIFISSSFSFSNAAMIDHSSGVFVLDDTTGLAWYKGVASFKGQSFAQQLVSISQLDNEFDINQDGINDRLNWSIANHSQVNELITRYNLHNEVNRENFMSHFSLTRYQSHGDIFWEEEIYANIGSESSYGTFKLLQAYNYGPTVVSSDYVHDPYSFGEVRVTGPVFGDPESMLSLNIFGALAVADVEYGSPVPEPSTMILFGGGLLSLVGITRRKNI